jgi:IMP cyclohydrolase
MQNKNIAEILSAHKYPGRGIIMGRNPAGNKAVIAYFIMGRSANSRNRVFVESGIHGRDVRSKAFDESLVTDPSLIIYTPVKIMGSKIIVTNGSQTDDIFRLMNDQLTFEQTQRFFTFEPDAPYYTPRISAMMHLNGEEKFNYSMAIAKTAYGDHKSCLRFLYTYSEPIPGQGHFIHTYTDDDTNLPSFCGDPVTISIPDGGIDDFTQVLWGSLNEENKVSLFVRYIDVSNGELASRIVNKNKRNA